MSDNGVDPLAPVVDAPAPSDANAPAAPNAGNGASAATSGSWLEQDETLRNMWMQNETPQSISAALNRSVPAIMTRAARLGLPRRSAPGRKPGRRLLSDQHDGTTVIRSDVARRSVRTSVAPLNEAPVTSLRVCLMCLHKFESAGRHNRICPSCKGSAEYESAASLSDIHVAAG